MKVAILILTLFLFSCESNNPDNDKDVSADEDVFNDSDNSETDDNFPDDLSDEALAESDENPDDDNPYEGPDFEEPDEDFSWKTCIPVPETEDELCFWPRETDVPCLLPDRYYVDFILSRNSKGNYNSKSVGLNDRYYYFMQSV
ncbi:MAG TPA: hypothetical protein PLW37_15065, partial [bacterium]|nr:hypothetical protein [bacterium]